MRATHLDALLTVQKRKEITSAMRMQGDSKCESLKFPIISSHPVQAQILWAWDGT